jgi:hypothetical protein
MLIKPQPARAVDAASKQKFRFTVILVILGPAATSRQIGHSVCAEYNGSDNKNEKSMIREGKR